jgi:hypothetical protein
MITGNSFIVGLHLYFQYLTFKNNLMEKLILIISIFVFLITVFSASFIRFQNTNECKNLAV